MLLALDAYRASLHGQLRLFSMGYTGDQRVFLGWAQVWCAKSAPCAQQQSRRTSFAGAVPYRRADAQCRCLVRRLGCETGDKLYLKPEDRVRFW